MANLAICNYCNAECPYCYIDNLKQCPIKTMSIEDYCSLLEWFAITEEEVIGITGGEPTLHPDFDIILKETDRYCRNLEATAVLYTNGLNLAEFIPYITDNFVIILNWVPNTDQNDIIALLYQQEFFTKEQAILKCPLYLGEKRYKEFWETVKTYNLKTVETCITMPYADYSKYRYDKEKYYMLMKPIFLNFCKAAINNDCIVSIDCPEIPFCYFTKEEQEIIEQACDISTIDQSYCLPVVEILPDWTASMCFCINDKPIDIRPFYSLNEVERYFIFKQNLPRIEGNCLGRCSACKEHEYLLCQGGCLGFADM